MKIRIGDLRRIVKEQLLREQDEGDENVNPFFTSPDGQRWINTLMTVAKEFDDTLQTKFDLMIQHLKQHRMREALDVATGIEAHIKQSEQSFMKKMQLAHQWREGLKTFLQKFKEATSDEVRKQHVKKLVAPHVKGLEGAPKKQPDEVDWSKELGKS